MNLPPRPLALPFFALKRARNASYTRVTRERLVTKRKGQWEGFHLPAFLCSQIFIDRGTFEENAMGSLSESTMRGNILIIVLINIMLSLMSASWSLVKPTWMPRQFFKGGKWLTVMVMFILDSQTCQSGKRTIYWACYPYWVVWAPTCCVPVTAQTKEPRTEENWCLEGPSQVWLRALWWVRNTLQETSSWGGLRACSELLVPWFKRVSFSCAKRPVFLCVIIKRCVFL